MLKLIRADNGMNILGQGGKIILFTLPSVAAALWLDRSRPELATLPAALEPLRFLGYVLLVPGALLWIGGIAQLLVNFPRGRLVTDGAYGVCRNPIYASFIVFILPAASILTQAWIWLAVAAFLYLGVRLFIGPEEKRLLDVFGDHYAHYLRRVSRIAPFLKPAKQGF